MSPARSVTPLRTLVFVFFTCAAVSALADSASLALGQYRLDAAKSEKTALLRRDGQAPPALETRDPAILRLLADRPFAKLIEGAAREAALDPALVHAVIAIESGYNQGARSPKGALGLMQVMPGTALRYGVRNAAHSPVENLRAGTRYLKELMTLFNQRLELVLAAYNAGEGAVMRYGERIPPYRETQLYVPAVLALYREWREPAPMATSPAGAAPARIRVEYMPGTALDTDALNAAGYR